MTQDVVVPKYRYLIARVSDGAFVMEVPFGSVSWERKINSAGSFSGSIAVPGNYALDDIRVSTSEDHFDLYNSTLPGKNAIYIMRDDQIVWGGIIWTRSYDIGTKVLNVTAMEFVSYLYHRIFWKTFILPEITTSIKGMLETFIGYVNNDQDTINSTYAASDTHNLMTYYAHSGTTVTFTTEEKHGFTAGDLIKIGNHNSASGTTYNYDGDSIPVVSVPNDRQFTIYNSNNLTGGSIIGTTAYAADSGVYSILQSTYDRLQSASAINLTYDIDSTLDGYKIIGTGDNNPFEFRGHKMTYVGEIIENFSKNGVPAYTTAVATGGDYPKATVGSVVKRITKKANTTDVSTITTSETHGFIVGNSVTIANVDSVFNGTYTITAVTDYTFSFAQTIDPDVPETLVGSDVVTVRFDFHVVSDYDPSTRTFNNVFKAWFVKKDVNNPMGDNLQGAGLSTLTGPSSVYGPDILGANQLIFEHPGNIISLTLDESAEKGASRTWVVDSYNDLGSSATPYYGSYTNLPYLDNLFPLLEVAVTDRNLPTENDQAVVPYAKEIGYRLAPPVGDYRIIVNGSLSPQVGTYLPGDWCTVIPHDEFINNRLRVPYENRDGLLVRKIGSYKVNVPDNPTFPETVELELLIEWEVTNV